MVTHGIMAKSIFYHFRIADAVIDATPPYMLGHRGAVRQGTSLVVTKLSFGRIRTYRDKSDVRCGILVLGFPNSLGNATAVLTEPCRLKAISQSEVNG